MSDRVQDALAAFDGRHVASLRASVARGLSGTDLAVLTAALPGPTEVAATWILKAVAETRALEHAVATEVFRALGALTEPDAVLHVLQMAQHHPDAARSARADIEALLKHRRTLVRVWALDALARADPAAARARVAAALDAPEASMRARAKALKSLVMPPIP